LAVAVRAIAARDLTESNAPRYILREAMTAMSNGLIFALVLALVVAVWFPERPLLSLAIALAVLINFASAGLAGILVPLTLRRLGADPAVSSSVFVTFVTDIVGFLAFLGLATLILLS
jgi:magnesium transporter